MSVDSVISQRMRVVGCASELVKRLSEPAPYETSTTVVRK